MAPPGIALAECPKIDVVTVSHAHYDHLDVPTLQAIGGDALYVGTYGGGIVRRVMLPGAAPQIAETLRLVLGWAWTYVIVAELIGSESGIGHMIMDSQRLLDTGQMIFGIVCIGVIGLVSDLIFKWGNQRLYPWAF